MYPDTIFNWHDNSAITVPETNAEIDDAPLFLQVFSADKGPEDLIEISGDDFTALYGTMRFDRHGQAGIQAQNIINAGGKLFAKRVVASDSTLANTVLCAKVTTSDSGVSVKWESQSITGCKTFDDVKKAAEELLDDQSGVYPLIVYTDNGRGASNKAVRLNPDYATSKTVGKTFYNLVVYEGTNVIEQTTVSFDPTVVYAENAYRLDQYTNVQITGLVIDDIYELYAEKLADCLAIDVETVRSYDIVYGYTNRGQKIEGFTLDESGVDLDSQTGIKLVSGDNGEFGVAPIKTNPTALSKAIENVFNGNFSDEIWDVDQHKVALVLDANYPVAVKKAMFDFVSFRKDCVYLRDYGTDLTTFLEIKAAYDGFNEQRNCFVSDYMTSYQIKDPVTKKNIEVTMLYDLAYDLVSHIANNPYAPVAGSSNGMILRNAIKGTINFTPVNTPSVNQKEAIDELKVNYAIFEDEQCIVQSCYTSQEEYTQLSYLNNVLGIQRVLRAVRTACPKQRFSLTTGQDLQDYADAVNKVLANYVTNFDVLNFVYTQDDLKMSQKIFYASIEFAFLNWAQTEIFDVYAINNN